MTTALLQGLNFHCVKNVRIYRKSPYLVQMRENTEKLRITKMLTKCFDVLRSFYEIGSKVNIMAFHNKSMRLILRIRPEK